MADIKAIAEELVRMSGNAKMGQNRMVEISNGI